MSNVSGRKKSWREEERQVSSQSWKNIRVTKEKQKAQESNDVGEKDYAEW